MMLMVIKQQQVGEVDLIGFIINPYVIWALLLGAITYQLGRTGAQETGTRLSVSDSWAANWYLFNGFFFHLILDGFGGAFQAIPLVATQFRKLDKRYTSGTHMTVPYTIGLVEIYFMAPLCLYAYYLIKTGSRARYAIEIIVSTAQFVGLLIFCGAEIVDGNLNVPGTGSSVGVPGNRWANIKTFDENYLIYYWFGFWAANLIWAVVPYLRVSHAIQTLSK